MKKLVLLALIAVALPALAADISMNTAVNSRYVWRGLLVNNHAVFQPDVTVAGSGFEFNVWGSMDLTDNYNNQFEFNEVDYTLSYNWHTSRAEWSAGVISYVFPNTDLSSTTEAYVGVTLKHLTFSPSVTAYYDFDEVDGLYLEFGTAHEFENGISLGATLGYASKDYVNGYFVVDGDVGGAFTDYSISVDYPVALRLGELNLNVTYTNLVDTHIHSPGFRNGDNNLIFGVNWSYSF
jgi:uncharacterized protein (TIGR02001 family)